MSFWVGYASTGVMYAWTIWYRKDREMDPWSKIELFDTAVCVLFWPIAVIYGTYKVLWRK